jgi:4-carboxymuconolactone decarboxylase
MLRPSAPGPDRMPAIPDDKLSDEQRGVAAELAAGPRGGVRGPFVPMLRSPEFMRRTQKLGEYLRFNSAIPPRLSEFTILIVARHWGNVIEWQVHHPIALKAGLEPEVADAIAEGRRPKGMAADEAIVYDFCQELLHNKAVSDVTYARAAEAFQENGVVDLVGIVGYYGILAMLMNVARTPPLQPSR